MSNPEIQPLTTPPTILAASSRLAARVWPRNAAVAASTKEQQLLRQIAHAQIRVQYRNPLPLTQYAFYKQKQQAPKK